jgi:glutathione reductase (NADPH)
MPDMFDLIVLGSGSGGSTPARKCRAEGWRVAVIDDQPFGGTCANRGCDPKKVLIGAADVIAWHKRMHGLGIAGSASIDWPALMAFKRTFTDPVPQSTEESLEKAGIELFHGDARFVAEDRIRIGERELASKHFVIATGAAPRPLGIPGESLVIDSTAFLELPELPRRITFCGAGYISLEFAHLARRAGAEVVVLSRGVPLPGFDHTLVEKLIAHSRDIGIDLRLDAPVTAVERIPASPAFRVSAGKDASACVIETDLVVHGAGRIPNTSRIGVREGRIELGAHGAVRVNEFLQSVSNPRVYAAGDVAGAPGALPLTPVAAHEGWVVASNLLGGNQSRPDFRGTPSVVFTIPALASVGITEKAAREQGLNVRVHSDDSTEWYTNRRVHEPLGMYKIVIDADTDRVVGAHIIGASSEEVINVFALAVRFGITTAELKKMIFAYPTAASDIAYMVTGS